MRHGHIGVRLVGCVAEHHALVARADQVEGIGGCSGLNVVALVHALRDVGALPVDHVDDAARRAIEPVLSAVVTDARDDPAGDLLDIDIGLRANLTGDDHHARGEHGLHGAANVFELSGDAVGIDIALVLEDGLLGEYGVEHRVGNLVGDLIGMALGHRFRGEEIGAGRVLGACLLLGTKIVRHGESLLANV